MIVERERERESQRLPARDQLIQDGVIQAQRNGKGTFIGCSPTLLASDYKQVPLVLERVDECMNTERERERERERATAARATRNRGDRNVRE